MNSLLIRKLIGSDFSQYIAAKEKQKRNEIMEWAVFDEL